jgi:type II secretory pathway pseudopilin PulG
MTFGLQARSKNREQGFTYMEVIVAVMLMSLALIPALNAIRQSTAVSKGQQSLIANTYAVFSKMEYILAQPYESLSQAAIAAGGAINPSSYSDPVATPGRRLVFLALYDGDNDDSDNNPLTGGDPGLLWVKVELEGEDLTMESLTSQY